MHIFLLHHLVISPSALPSALLQSLPPASLLALLLFYRVLQLASDPIIPQLITL